MQIGFSFQQFKANFFNTPAMEKLLAPGERKAAGKMGGYVRRAARNSLKYSDGPAAANRPPNVHQFFTRHKANRKTGQVAAQPVSPLRELLFYAWDQTSKSTVVGPVLFAGSAKKHTSAATVPSVLEKGGVVRVSKDVAITKGHKSTRRQYDAFLAGVATGKIARKPVETRTVVTPKFYHAHPFMGPALTRSLPKFSSFFANSLRTQ